MRVAVGNALSDKEFSNLTSLSKSRSVSVRLAERAQIILLSAEGLTNREIGEILGVTRQKGADGAFAILRVESKTSVRMLLGPGVNQKSVLAKLPN